MKTPRRRTLFAQNGFRPVDQTVAKQFATKYPSRPGIFKVDDKIIGGWRARRQGVVRPEQRAMAKIEQAVGGPTSG